MKTKKQNLADLRSAIEDRRYDAIHELLNRQLSAWVWGSLDAKDLNKKYSDGDDNSIPTE